jgi:hypothetical protein
MAGARVFSPNVSRPEPLPPCHLGPTLYPDVEGPTTLVIVKNCKKSGKNETFLTSDYVRGSAGLVVICICADFFGTLLTGLGLRTTDPERKNKYYRVAIYSLGVAGL